MSNIDGLKVKTLIHKLGLKYQLKDSDIKELVESPYEFSALIIKNLKLDDITNLEELDKIKKNFMFTGFAKIFINPVAFENKLKNNNKLNLNKWKK